jgi:menaquinone-dependent protoporphyrinogen oxidase
MASILVIYGTTTGQTAVVARRIDDVLTERGHEVTTRHVSNPPAESVDSFDGVAVGASVNNNRHQRAVVEFIQDHRAALSSRPSAFFQLSFAAAVPWESAQSGSLQWTEALFADTDWHPDRVGNFAGAVNYTQYSRPVQWFFELAAAVTTGDTDTSRDYEYTDWDEVERFAREFGDFVEAQHSLTVRATERVPRVGRPGRRAAFALAGLGLAVALYRAVDSRRNGPARIRDGSEPRPRERAPEL